MKVVKLPGGKTLKFPRDMSDVDIQRAARKLLGGEEKAKPKENIIVNVPEFPEFPKFTDFPEPVDYTKALKDFSKQYAETNKAALKELQALGVALGSINASLNKQTAELSKAINMQADVLAELVVAYREPKKILRDERGRLEGIE